MRTGTSLEVHAIPRLSRSPGDLRLSWFDSGEVQQGVKDVLRSGESRAVNEDIALETATFVQPNSSRYACDLKCGQACEREVVQSCKDLKLELGDQQSKYFCLPTGYLLSRIMMTWTGGITHSRACMVFDQ